MNKTYKRKQLGILMTLMLLVLICLSGFSRSGSFSNTFISSGGESTILDVQKHNFLNGGSDVLADITGSERTLPQAYFSFPGFWTILGCSTTMIANDQEKIYWYSPQELEIIQKKHPKKVIVEIYSKDCDWCKKFENEVLSNPIIISYLNKHYYLLKTEGFDNRKIKFNGVDLESKNGFNPFTSKYMAGQVPISFPTQLFFDENYKFLNFLKGYNTPQNFEMAISYFGDNYYKTQNWGDFIKSFKGKIK